MIEKIYNKDIGVVLSCTGKNIYYDFCNTIVKDIRRLMPDVSICVYTDNEDKIHDFDDLLIGKHDNQLKYLSKIESILNSPYSSSIYIDVDSRLIYPVYEIYRILNKYDICICFADGRDPIRKQNYNPECTGIPLSTSTLAFNSNEKTKKLFESWKNIYVEGKKFPNRGDQMYLSYLIYRNYKIPYAVLPSEYRLNTSTFQNVGGLVKVITGEVCDRDPNGKISIDEINNVYNNPIKSRCFYPLYSNYKKCKTKTKSINNIKIITTIKVDGLKNKISKLYNAFKKRIRNTLYSNDS